MVQRDDVTPLNSTPKEQSAGYIDGLALNMVVAGCNPNEVRQRFAELDRNLDTAAALIESLVLPE